MCKDSKRTCTVIVLLIKPFVWWSSRCRRRGGLLKLPSYKRWRHNTLSLKNKQHFNLILMYLDEPHTYNMPRRIKKKWFFFVWDWSKQGIPFCPMTIYFKKMKAHFRREKLQVMYCWIVERSSINAFVKKIIILMIKFLSLLRPLKRKTTEGPSFANFVKSLITFQSTIFPGFCVCSETTFTNITQKVFDWIRQFSEFAIILASLSAEVKIKKIVTL